MVQVLDLCSLYGYTNPGLLDRIVSWVMEKLPRFGEELAEAMPSVVQAVREVGKGLRAAQGRRPEDDPLVDDDESSEGGVQDVLQYSVDIVASLRALTRGGRSEEASSLSPTSKAGRAFLGADGLLGELAALYGTVLDGVVDFDADLARDAALARRLILALSECWLRRAMAAIVAGKQASAREEAWELLYTTLGRMAGEDTAAGASRDVVRDLCQRCDLMGQLKALEGCVDKFGLEYLTQLVQARAGASPAVRRRKTGRGKAGAGAKGE